LVEAELIRGCIDGRGSGESSGEGMVVPRARPLPMIPVATRPEQVEPVARSIHLDLAPRGAVWMVGPRPDRIRSARANEPGGMAIRPGDQDWGLESPLPKANQPSAATGRRTAVSAPTSG